MKKIIIDGQVCIGPTYSNGEIAFIKRNLRNHKGLGELAGLLEVAGNVQRLKILYLLHACTEMCVCDIAAVLDITDSAVSQHIRKLKDKNLVKSRRDKQTIFYSLQDNLFISKVRNFFESENIKDLHAFHLNE